MPFRVGAERRELFLRGIVDGEGWVLHPELTKRRVALFAHHADEDRGVNLQATAGDLDGLALFSDVLLNGVAVQVAVVALHE